MLRVLLLGRPVDVHDLVPLVAHHAEHPHDVIGVLVDGVGEVEAPAAALRSRHDEQVGEPVAVQSEERLGALPAPLVAQGDAAAPHHHVERGRRHPLEAGGVDQDVEGVLGALVHHAALVDALHAAGRRVHQVHVGQVEGRQVLVVEGRPLAAVGVVGLERLRRLRVFDDRVHPRADLLHDPEVGIELLLDEFLGTQLSRVLLALLEVRDLAGEIIVVRFDRGAAR